MNKYIKKYYWKLHKMIFSKNFFPEGYLCLYPDVEKSGTDPWEHYVKYEKKKEEQTAIFLMMIFPVMIIFHFIMM